MPYLTPAARIPIQDYVDVLAEAMMDNSDDLSIAGTLNFVIFRLVHRIISTRGESYARYNGLIGAIECCKQELYRRCVGPYEDKAIERNGDVTGDA